MQQITSLYRYVVLVLNALNKSIQDQEKKNNGYKEFPRKSF